MPTLRPFPPARLATPSTLASPPSLGSRTSADVGVVVPGIGEGREMCGPTHTAPLSSTPPTPLPTQSPTGAHTGAPRGYPIVSWKVDYRATPLPLNLVATANAMAARHPGLTLALVRIYDELRDPLRGFRITSSFAGVVSSGEGALDLNGFVLWFFAGLNPKLPDYLENRNMVSFEGLWNQSTTVGTRRVMEAGWEERWNVAGVYAKLGRAREGSRHTDILPFNAVTLAHRDDAYAGTGTPLQMAPLWSLPVPMPNDRRDIRGCFGALIMLFEHAAGCLLASWGLPGDAPSGIHPPEEAQEKRKEKEKKKEKKKEETRERRKQETRERKKKKAKEIEEMRQREEKKWKETEREREEKKVKEIEREREEKKVKEIEEMRERQRKEQKVYTARELIEMGRERARESRKKREELVRRTVRGEEERAQVMRKKEEEWAERRKKIQEQENRKQLEAKVEYIRAQLRKDSQ
ncbi:hypothetical protein IAT38_000140 [Cryptococcus sp. DSM 104549]